MVKKNTIFTRTPILIFICLFLLTSCNKDAEIFIGTVHTIDAENKRMLVISGLKEEDLKLSESCSTQIIPDEGITSPGIIKY
ncbi:hypothetical protein PBOR_13535 [Paenibacillus borealis]|uniref:Uncharacterized protein n=1 Tax=Paenibacillus borealis TaxID=160799 RepID=A0A089LFC6_PAEBO|nr:hypothetical protein PBOR_13535 [Paenibacillus borealis]